MRQQHDCPPDLLHGFGVFAQVTLSRTVRRHIEFPTKITAGARLSIHQSKSGEVNAWRQT
jgi:hypothetical protein